MKKGWLWFLGGAALVLLVGFLLRMFAAARMFGRAFNFRMVPHPTLWGAFPSVWMMIIMGLIPLLVIVLLVLGIIALSRSVKSSPQKEVKELPDNTPKTCPACNRTVQADWKHCPYCGTDLES